MWVVVIVVFLSFAFNFIGMQVSTGDVLDDWFESDEEYVEDRYVSVTRELSEDGELYDMVLEAGTYIVGVHIPEGTYYIEEEQAETYGGFYLEDDENLIYFGESFDEDDEIEIIEDIRCYAGAKLSVRERARFVSENAQTGSMTGLANPLTEEVTVSDGFVAGTDFPAGTYDVVMQSGDTSFAYLVPGTIPENSDEEYEGVTERFWIDTSDGTFVKKNIYMPSGTKIMIDAGEVQLVPSEIIPESYEDYYFIY